MKKLLTFLACFIAAVGASSQGWEVAQHTDNPQAYTNIMADLVVTGGDDVYALGKRRAQLLQLA